MRNLLFSVLAIVILSGCSTQDTSPKNHPGLNHLFTEIAVYEKSVNPFSELASGKHPTGFPSVSHEEMQKSTQQFEAYLEKLNNIPTSELSHQEVISQSVMALKLNDIISDVKYNNHLIPFNAEGGFYNLITYYLGSLPFATTSDYEAYFNWLPKYADFINQNQGLMAEGIQQKVVAPKVIVNNMTNTIKPWASEDMEINPLARPLLKLDINASISESEKTELLNKGTDLLKNTVVPAYKELLAFTGNQYLAAAYDEVGISNVPDGKAYYEDRVRYYTTLDMTPDSIYNLGLQEVARIRTQMEAIIKDLEFEGDFGEFLTFLRTDEQFYPKTADELLHYAAWLSKRAEGILPRYFHTLYMMPFTVEPVPDDIAPTYTAGRYVQGIAAQQRPGIYWVNTYNLPSRKFYSLPALTLHEAVPGHHLQIMLAAESKTLDVPKFRNDYYISAFGEGWALYAEYLGEEMGMYPSPYDMFGKYTYEMWRACRLVVDVGLHYKGWTRDQARQYLADNTALSQHEIYTEIDRYIGWPGQAVSYKIGELVIKSLREEASEKLGDKFDLRKFHHVILKNGSVPLSVLTEEVEAYIEETAG
ncbi:MAG: DUF885 family protein [Bacteroidota bacterium]